MSVQELSTQMGISLPKAYELVTDALLVTLDKNMRRTQKKEVQRNR